MHSVVLKPVDPARVELGVKDLPSGGFGSATRSVGKSAALIGLSLGQRLR